MKKISIDKNIFKNRTVLGLICIVLSLIICFGITPLMNGAIKAQSEIVRVKTDISKGTQITDSMLETVTVGSYNLPADVQKSKESVVGKYATLDLRNGDYILSGKLSANPLTDSPYLAELDGTKTAVSVTIPSLAAGLSGKLEAGDIISVISADTDTGLTTIPNELRYVKVLAVTASTGSDKEYTQKKADSEENPKDSLPATLTLLANTEQAKVLAGLEANSRIHTALVYRGAKANADKFLAAQDEYFIKPESAPQPSDTIPDTQKTTPQEDDKTDGN